MPDQPDTPPLLPQRAGGARPAAPPATDSLSLDQAVAIYGVSVSTLRRKLRANEVAGAYKVPGPKGDEWRIPAGALEQIGYEPIAAAPAAPAAAAPAEPPGELRRALEALTGVMERFDTSQRMLQAAEQDRGRAEREREQARVEAAELRGQVAALQAELKLARRRWWRRR